MSFLEHLDELRSRLLRCIIAYVVVFAGCWYYSDALLQFLLRPIRRYLFDGGDIVFINLTEPFMVYLKAAALIAIFLSAPFVLHQLWGFVSPGLYRNERHLGLLFLVFGSAFFLVGGAFGYWVAIPITARWLLGIGTDYVAQITLRSAFQFEGRILLAMGLVFEMPIAIFFLARIGVVTPEFLMRHFKTAVIVIVTLAAIITPTGDVITLSVFSVPMILLYLLGVTVAWLFGRQPETGS